MSVDGKQQAKYEAAGLRAQALAAEGMLADAESIARSIPDTADCVGWFHEKIIAFVCILRGHARDGSIESALHSMRELERLAKFAETWSTWELADVFLDVGRALVQMGETERAAQYFARAGSEAASHQTQALECRQILADVSRELANLELRREAFEVAESIGWTELRERVLREIRPEED